jgi:hypothetical protein
MEKPRSLDERDKFWERHLREWMSSGLCQAEYCRRNGLSSKSFGYWKRRHKEAREPVQLVEIPMAPQPSALHRSCLSPVRVMVGSLYRIEIEKGFDPQVLDQLIGFLENR